MDLYDKVDADVDFNSDTEKMIHNFFGPPIYYAVMSEEHLSMLQDIAVKSVDAPAGYDLAGNIKVQNDAIVDDKPAFKNFVEHHIIEFCKEIQKGAGQFTYHLGNGPWINYMRQHEFNPLHVHDGTLSVVAFIDVPEEIDKEESNGLIRPTHSLRMLSLSMLNHLILDMP